MPREAKFTEKAFGIPRVIARAHARANVGGLSPWPGGAASLEGFKLPSKLQRLQKRRIKGAYGLLHVLGPFLRPWAFVGLWVNVHFAPKATEVLRCFGCSGRVSKVPQATFASERAASEISPGTKKFFCKSVLHTKATPFMGQNHFWTGFWERGHD